MSLDPKSADKELKAVTPKKSKARHHLYKKVGNNFPVIKNQK